MLKVAEVRADLEATTRVAPSVQKLVEAIADVVEQSGDEDLAAQLREEAPHLANSCIAGTPTEGELPDPAAA